MKLIYLHQYYNSLSEPGPHRSAYLASSLSKAGWDVQVITSGKAQIKRTEIKNNPNVHYLPVRYNQKMNYFRRSIAFVYFMILGTFKVISLGKSDILYASSTPLSVGVMAVLMKYIRGQKYVFEVRDVWPEAVIAIGAVKSKIMQKWLYFQERIIYKNADYIVPLSTDMQKSIVERFPKFTNKTNVVIENISEVDRFQSPKVVLAEPPIKPI